MKKELKINLDYVNSKEIINETHAYLMNNHLINKKLEIRLIENGIILPYKSSNENKDFPNGGCGGVLNDVLEFVNESAYDGGWLKQGAIYNFNKRDIINEKKDVIYIGHIGQHFGHFLIDQVSRLWFVNSDINLNDIYIAYIADNDISGNFLEFLKLLGIKIEKCIRVNKPMRFNRIYIPDQSAKPGEWYTNEFKNIFKTVTKNALKNTNISSNNKKIYFTRTHFNIACKKEIGENIYEDIFKKNGYEILIPEKLSLSEMIYYINTSETIVCINGTIPLNIIFALHPINLIVLNKTEIFHKNLMYFIDIIKNSITYIDIYSPKYKGKNIGVGPFLMTLTDNMKKYCENEKLFIPNNIKKYELKNRITFMFLYIRRKIRDYLHPIRKKIKLILSKYS